MHDDFSEIEAALRRLQPRAPSEFCLARITTAMSPVPFWKRRSLMWFATSAAAACLAAVLVGPGLLPEQAGDTAASPTSVAASTDSGYTCTDVRRTLSTIKPLEVQQAPDGRYYRPYQVQYLNTVQWKNNDTNATLVKSTPSQTVQFLPVELI